MKRILLSALLLGGLMLAVAQVEKEDLATKNTKSHNAQASQPTSGSVFRDCPDCPEMVVLPAASFTMGSSAEEKSWAASHGSTMGSFADEAPQYQVSLPSFALGKHDVTRAEYAAFARETR